MTYTLLWGDTHIHAEYSVCFKPESIPDGFDGSPADCYRYARDVAEIDFAAVTDHTFSGLGKKEPVVLTEDQFGVILEANRAYHDPGRFVTIPAYEWNSPLDRTYGHHNAYFCDDEPPLLPSGHDISSINEMWAAFDELPYEAMMIPHHLARDQTPYDWSTLNPRYEPVVEITSNWGNYEYKGNPHACDPNWSPGVPGSFLQDGLAQGYRVGVIGSSDSHSGHSGGHHPPFDPKIPGRPANPISAARNSYRRNILGAGLAGVYAEEFTREGIFAALHARRCYAATGRKIRLWTETNGHIMGADAGTLPDESRTVHVEVNGTAPIAHITLVRNNVDVRRFHPQEPAADVTVDLVDDDPLEKIVKVSPPVADGNGDSMVYYYVRVVQADERTAWSSPVWYTASA